MEYERTISLAGCGNFRDLGGYETRDGRIIRWRRLFRSDALSWLTADDVCDLEAMGVKLAAGFDLRTEEELQQIDRGVIYENGTRHHHVPFFRRFGNDRERRAVALATGQVASEQYLSLLQQARACFRGMFEMLARESSYPAAYYCAAGKDRTGMVTAVLLRALRVPDQRIVEDYALTLAPTRERLIARYQAMGRDPDTIGDTNLLAAQPETMQHFLEGFDRLFGSVEDFLAGCGVDAATLDAVRLRLLE